MYMYVFAYLSNTYLKRHTGSWRGKPHGEQEREGNFFFTVRPLVPFELHTMCFTNEERINTNEFFNRMCMFRTVLDQQM